MTKQTTSWEGSLRYPFFNTLCLTNSLFNRIGRYDSFYGSEHLDGFDEWGNQGEFFELHWLLGASQGTTVNLPDSSLNREVLDV